MEQTDNVETIPQIDNVETIVPEVNVETIVPKGNVETIDQKGTAETVARLVETSNNLIATSVLKPYKKDWPAVIRCDTEIKQIDPNGLFVVCKLCPDATIVRTRQGRTYDVSRWKEHIITQKHMRNRDGIETPSRNPPKLPASMKVQPQTCQGAMSNKKGLIHLFAEYGQVNYSLMYFVIENGQTKLYSRNCTREIILNRSRKKYSSFHACKMCKLLHDDKNLRRKIIKMRNVERALNIKTMSVVTPSDLAFLKKFVRDSKPSERKMKLQTEIKRLIGYLQICQGNNISINGNGLVNIEMPSEEKSLTNNKSPQSATLMSTASMSLLSEKSMSPMSEGSMSPLSESSKAHELVSVKKSQLDQISARLDVLEKKLQISVSL
mmetsp:Transcript_18206/g.20974  ORF Transcript_18206/g.20974 Transcript_18206/m.20974 type:complete len:380 (+) Transcript_18206:84-1223(+)